MSVRLAVVGSVKFTNGAMAIEDARMRIRAAIDQLKPEAVISGGARGIDTLAAETARECGVPVIEHLPENKRWEPNGFKARNLLIAEDCTHLVP